MNTAHITPTEAGFPEADAEMEAPPESTSALSSRGVALANCRGRSSSFEERSKEFIRGLQLQKQMEKAAAEEAAEKQALLVKLLKQLVLSGKALSGGPLAESQTRMRRSASCSQRT